ncbi:DUF4278 domain-containing protein [Chamaesiphon minutus]|uniref:DUF4278 domain-containing protein n=1 Tax=Chamaesiphon minutus (strain ATCC 27169 / PCC 6605) TaxID=1173020 RepID=K9UEF2_CHAP6|nr:hypothetical protein Cha6605_2124 [Chamaesiphon minutus PCC 6605]
MNLTYRGNNYNSNSAKLKSLFSAQNQIKSVHKLMYRGNTYQFGSNTSAVKSIGYKLTYQGNTYYVN